MLPSFRLIVATFLCGFLAVFAGLRIVAVTHITHESLPGLASQAAAAPAVIAHTSDGPRIEIAVPVLFDLRSVMNAASAAPVPARLTPPDEPPADGAGPESAAPEPAIGIEAKPEPEAAIVVAPAVVAPAILAPLSILPGLAAPVEPEVAAVLEPLAILPGIAAPAEPPPAPAAATADPAATASVKRQIVKQPLRAINRAARAKRARQAARDPFSFSSGNRAPQ